MTTTTSLESEAVTSLSPGNDVVVDEEDDNDVAALKATVIPTATASHENVIPAPTSTFLSMEQVGKLLKALELLKHKGTDVNHPTYKKCLMVLEENSEFFKNPLPYLQSLSVARTMAPYLLDQHVLERLKSMDHGGLLSDLNRLESMTTTTTTTTKTSLDLHGSAHPERKFGHDDVAMNSLFTDRHFEMLETQIQVYKYIARGMKVPDHLQKLILGDIPLVTSKTTDSSKNDMISLESKDGLKINQQQHATTKQAALESSYQDPYKLFQRHLDMKRTLIPSIMPTGIDPRALREERERRIRAKIASRMKQLGDLPSSLSEDMKRRAMIELKALRLLDRQKKLRMELLTAANRAMTLETSFDRASYRRFKKQSIKEAKLTERLERQHRLEREKKEKHKNQEFLTNLLQHSRYLKETHRNSQARAVKISRSVLQYHVNLEKEEQKRQERVEKERIKALRADDEEAYLKLIDQKKDTRITHLLRQTDSYLSSLAKLVLEQKRAADLESMPTDRQENEDFIEMNSDGVKEYYQIAHTIQEDVKEQPTILVNGRLKEYQMRGLQWLVSLYNNNLNGILADEMGLGKTIQTIALISYLIETKRQNGPFLVIVPLSTLTNWVLEFEKWSPTIITIIYKGTPGVRRQIYNQQMKGAKFNVLLTTYEYIIRDRSMLAKIKWTYLVVDEGHRMKNTHCKLTQTLSQYYHCRHRLLLTGTPLQNSLPELWALLNFLLPKIFNSVKNFEEWFNMPFANTGERMELNEEEKLLIIRRLHKVLRPFLLRRLKKDVESELPDKVERVIKCQLSALQKKLCTEIKRIGVVYSHEDDQKRRKIFARGLNNTIMQLRKVCNHPFVFPEIERQINPQKVTDELIYRVSGKFELLDRILPKLLVTGHKVLMFFQMTQVMTIMEDFCNWKNFKYLRLDGATKSEDRSELLMQFNSPSSDCFLFLLSTRAGGLGLNLQSADTVIIFDSDWNPHQDLQAQDRAHRIGQTKEVRIFRLISIDSVEEHILARAQYKLNVDEKVIQAGKFDQKSTAEEREEVLRTLFEQEPEEGEEMGDGVWDDDELNEVIARSEEEVELFKKFDRERLEIEHERWMSSGDKKYSSPPSRLIEAFELPTIYLEETQNGLVNEAGTGFDETTFGEPEEHTNVRHRRAKGNVIYDDGLSEDQFLRTIEEGGDLQEVIEAKRKRKQNRYDKLKKNSEHSMESNSLDTENSDSEQMEEDELHSSEISTRRTANSKHRKVSRYSGTRDDLAGESESDDHISADPFADPLMSLFTLIENTFDEQQPTRQRSYLFLSLPSKRMYPDYYVAIKRPISMNEIRHKLKDHKYHSTREFLDDFDLMFANAMHYNVEGSEVYEDAVYLKSLLHRKMNEASSKGSVSRNECSSSRRNDQAITPVGLKLSIRLPKKSKSNRVDYEEE